MKRIIFDRRTALALGAGAAGGWLGLGTTGCQRDPNRLGAQAIQAGNITILDTRTDLADRARAKQNVEDALISYPDIDCLVGLWSYNGPAILSAVKDAGKQGQVNIVCFDEEEDTLQGVEDGHIHATVVQQPYQFGYHSVRILAALARGDDSVLPADEIYDIPVIIVRPDEAAEFRVQLSELIEAGRTAQTPPTSDERIEVAFLTNNVSDFWQIARAGIRTAESEYNARCEFLLPPTGTPDEQQRMVETQITRGVSGLAISPNDAANQIEMINRACEVMNVITHDSDAPETDRLCYVGTNNYTAGREAGKLIREALPEGGKIMLFVGRLDAQNAIERRDGIIDELQGAPLT